ncbi:hypothetical protein BKA62DRAFT_495528 [Auriculariales sp. MPI-PUGE-AT-0066]|nr:hypothetical protein BKA62DRAFT_495528 [Auriculariales sp. MPI-PUGE-AT-0066]
MINSEDIVDRLPPSNPLARCNYCHKSRTETELALCPTCTQQVYCASVDAPCRTNDAQSHKQTCRPIQRLDLHTFHVVLAILGALGNRESTKMHPALRNMIAEGPTIDPNGVPVIKLGAPWNLSLETVDQWFPHAPSRAARLRLWRRIAFSGPSLHTHISAALAVLAELYMKTQFGYGLQLAGMPVLDFGVAFGAAPVLASDSLCFDGESKPNLVFQNPSVHCWLWFKNGLGQVATFDACMFGFNCSALVSTTGFSTGTVAGTVPSHIPAVWREDDADYRFYIHRHSLSVLRASRMQRVARRLIGCIDAGNSGVKLMYRSRCSMR